MTVLITGIRGSIARRVADALHARGADVRATSAAAGGGAGLPYRTEQVDLTAPAALPDALRGVDQVLLYAAAEAADEIGAMLRASDVEQVVVVSSASVADPRLQVIAEHHSVVEDAVRDVKRWTMLRPDVFARNTLGWAGPIRAGRVAIPYPDAYVEPVHEADIADVAVAALTSDELDGREVLLTGPQSLTQRDQVATIGDALGTAIEVDALEPEIWREQVSAFMPGSAADALLSLWAARTSPAPIEHTATHATGGTSRTYAQWVTENLDAFR